MPKKRIFVNATTLTVGGGAQVAATFIVNSFSDNNYTFLYAVSDLVYNHLSAYSSDPRLIKISPSPARILSGRSSRKKLEELEGNFKPDIVFTVFGPAYMRFKAKHVCGIGDGWLTHRNSFSMKTLGVVEKVKMLTLLKYKLKKLSAEDYYWVEATVARRGLSRLLKIEEDRVAVIPNCLPYVFKNVIAKKNKVKKTIRMLSIASPYPHKNLNIIPLVASILKKQSSKYQFEFLVTIPKGTEEELNFMNMVEKLGVNSMISNLGIVRLQDLPCLYKSVDISFLPTLLETFSVTFLESMYMGRPIVTTDIKFTRDICAGAAEYYAPTNPISAAEAILRVIKSPGQYEELVENGYNQFKKFPNSLEKYEMHMKWLCSIVEKND